MTEREPRDATWQQLCERLDVLLLWPDRLLILESLLSQSPAAVGPPRDHA